VTQKHVSTIHITNHSTNQTNQSHGKYFNKLTLFTTALNQLHIFRVDNAATHVANYWNL